MLGGSLGARTLNNSMVEAFPKLAAADDVQVIWQSGRYYYKELQQLQEAGKIPPNVHLFDFVNRMDYAYSVADLRDDMLARRAAEKFQELSHATF